jgi:D-alanine-D-alanine ligase
VNTNTWEYYFNEINTIPGSFSFYLWEESDVTFDQLLLELIEIAIEQHQKKNGRVQSYETNLLSQKAVKGLKGLKGGEN